MAGGGRIPFSHLRGKVPAEPAPAKAGGGWGGLFLFLFLFLLVLFWLFLPHFLVKKPQGKSQKLPSPQPLSRMRERG